jgi:hypothetical protein
MNRDHFDLTIELDGPVGHAPHAECVSPGESPLLQTDSVMPSMTYGNAA